MRGVPLSLYLPNRRVGKAINKPNAAKQQGWVKSYLLIVIEEEIFAPHPSYSYVVDAQDDNCVDVHLFVTKEYRRVGKAINKPNAAKQQGWA